MTTKRRPFTEEDEKEYQTLCEEHGDLVGKILVDGKDPDLDGRVIQIRERLDFLEDLQDGEILDKMAIFMPFLRVDPFKP